MENRTMFSSLDQTPSFPYKTDKIQGKRHLASQHRDQHWNQHSNITIVFYSV